MGFGSTRFRAGDLKDEEGLWRCAELVRKASALGVNFFDVAPAYADGMAERIYGMAFKVMPDSFFVSDKSIITADKTAGDVRRRIEQQLACMGLERIAFYHMWSVMNIEHFRQVMARGGPYDGALQAKNEGLIEHICFSTHANASENLEIIGSGAFEGVTLPFNAMNHGAMLPVVRAAAAREMGVAVMNPLCGGMVVQQAGYFDYLIQLEDESIAAAALRFVSSFPGITTVLSGISEENEIAQNAAALSHDPVIDRPERVRTKARELGGRLCTGCGYCAGCPAGIPVSEYMQAYNMRYFPNIEYMGRVISFDDESQIAANNVFRTLRQNSGIVPESAVDPCEKCGQCEEKCTQHLPIMEHLEEMSALAAKHSYSKAHLLERIGSALERSATQRIGLYPTGVYTEAAYAFLKKHFPDRQISVFDKNPELWGKSFSDLTINSPQDIPSLVDTLLITHYLYQDSIYRELSPLRDKGVDLIKLHNSGDIPYFC